MERRAYKSGKEVSMFGKRYEQILYAAGLFLVSLDSSNIFQQ